MKPGRALAGLWLPLVVGCALTSRGTPVEVTWYTPEPGFSGGEKPADASGPELRLGRVSSGPALGDRISHSNGGYEVGYYDTRRWTDEPRRYVERALSHALFDAHGFRHGEADAPTLNVEVLNFDEVDAPNAHRARITVRLTLTRNRVLFEDTVSVEEPVHGQPFDAVVAAMARALDKLSAEVAQRVTAAMTNPPAAGTTASGR